MLTATMVAPTGVAAKIDINIPAKAQTTAITADAIITRRKLLNTRMAEIAGKIINAEISREPTSFIASTITVAVIIAIIKLYLSALIPVALAKFSSNVTAKIL